MTNSRRARQTYADSDKGFRGESILDKLLREDVFCLPEARSRRVKVGISWDMSYLLMTRCLVEGYEGLKTYLDLLVC